MVDPVKLFPLVDIIEVLVLGSWWQSLEDSWQDVSTKFQPKTHIAIRL